MGSSHFLGTSVHPRAVYSTWRTGQTVLGPPWPPCKQDAAQPGLAKGRRQAQVCSQAFHKHLPGAEATILVLVVQEPQPNRQRSLWTQEAGAQSLPDPELWGHSRLGPIQTSACQPGPDPGDRHSEVWRAEVPARQEVNNRPLVQPLVPLSETSGTWVLSLSAPGTAAAHTFISSPGSHMPTHARTPRPGDKCGIQYYFPQTGTWGGSGTQSCWPPHHDESGPRLPAHQGHTPSWGTCGRAHKKGDLERGAHTHTHTHNGTGTPADILLHTCTVICGHTHAHIHIHGHMCLLNTQEHIPRHLCMHSCTHTCTNTHLLTHTRIHMYTAAHMHTCTHSYMPHTYKCMHSTHRCTGICTLTHGAYTICVRTYMCTHMHILANRGKCTYTSTHTHMCTHSLTCICSLQKHMHTHTCAQVRC